MQASLLTAFHRINARVSRLRVFAENRRRGPKLAYGATMKLLSGIPIALLLAACAQPSARVCALPPLGEAEVRKIGSSHLEVKGVDAAFRANAESRVTAVGCHHEYEVSEKLDSFGIGFVVEVGRDGKVLGIHSTE